MSGKGQAYCPKCKKLNPGHEYGRCRLVQCTICKEFGHSSFQCGKGSCWICGSKDHFKSACPEYYSEEFKRQKLVEGKKVGSKGKAPLKRASTEKVSGPSPSKVSNLPSLLELPTPPPTTKSYAQTVTGAKASPASTPTPQPAQTEQPSTPTPSTSSAPTDAETLLASFEQFKSNLARRTSELVELEDEEREFEEFVIAKRKEFVDRRKALIDAQENENQVREAMAKAEEFMAILKKSYSKSPAQSLERLSPEPKSATPPKASPKKVDTSKVSPSQVPLPDSPASSKGDSDPKPAQEETVRLKPLTPSRVSSLVSQVAPLPKSPVPVLKLSKDLLTTAAPAVASTSSAGKPEPMDTIPAPDGSTPAPVPAGSSASGKPFSKLKDRVSTAKETIIARFRNLSEKKEDGTEKLLKETDEVLRNT